MPALSPDIAQAVQYLHNGQVIAYPTEAVYGLGCDPFNRQAVNAMFHMKHRPVDKGLILVAAEVSQLEPWIALSGQAWETQVRASWPGPVTWVIPLQNPLPDWITGGRNSVAVRVSAHPTVQALCHAFSGPIVSTSANVTGQPPAKSCEDVKNVFAEACYCVDGALGQQLKPTSIWEAKTGKQLR